jgi:hypothetical protein
MVVSKIHHRLQFFHKVPTDNTCVQSLLLKYDLAQSKILSFSLIAGTEEDSSFKPDSTSYYFEVDVKFEDVRNGRSRSIFLGFNYDTLTANGHDTPLEIVALRFYRKKLCAQFLTVSDGKSIDITLGIYLDDDLKILVNLRHGKYSKCS